MSAIDDEALKILQKLSESIRENRHQKIGNMSWNLNLWKAGGQNG